MLLRKDKHLLMEYHSHGDVCYITVFSNEPSLVPRNFAGECRRKFTKLKSPAMKIAIPTNDGIHIADQPLTAKGFHVFTIEFGEIAEDELRWRVPPDSKIPENGSLKQIGDCSVILVNRDNGSAGPAIPGIQSTPVRDKVIAKIIWKYLSGVVRREADTCCCP